MATLVRSDKELRVFKVSREEVNNIPRNRELGMHTASAKKLCATLGFPVPQGNVVMEIRGGKLIASTIYVAFRKEVPHA